MTYRARGVGNGNSVGITIPQAIAKMINLKPKDELDIQIKQKKIIISKI